MVWSLIIHQTSTSVLFGNLDSWFVSMGMVYCVMKSFVTFVRTCSRLIESCVGLISLSYRPDLIFVCTNARRRRRSYQSCVIWCRLLQPIVQRCRRHSSWLSLQPTLQVKKKKCSEGPTENNSEDLGVPSKIIKMLESHNFGFSIVLPVTVYRFIIL